MGLLNLAAIESSLRQVQSEFESINQRLSGQRDPMSDAVVENLLAGYTYIDILVDWGIDVFAMGKHKYLLELNNIVLCGPDQELRAGFSQHIEATKNRFYDEPEGGIEDIVEWRARHLDQSVWQLAAGLYVRTLSKPQLFVEGNHRTGALIMSHVLAWDGKPPFVLTVKNAKAYFDPSSLVKGCRKHSLRGLFEIPKLRKRFAELLKAEADPAFLLQTPAAALGASGG